MTGGARPFSGSDPGRLARWREWFLLNGDRLHVLGLVLFAIFSSLTAVAVSSLVPFRNVQPLYYVFSGLVSGNLTLITVVVAINQLLLSREFSTPDQLRSQIEGVIDYRTDIEAVTGRIAPVEPSGFLRLLVEYTRRDAQDLGGLAFDETDAEVRERIDSIVATVTGKLDRIDGLLQRSGASTFDTLSTTLSTNYAHDINELRRLKHDHSGQLPNHVDGSIDDLIERLKDIDVARQYFKTIYLQEELATLSRLLFYVGLVSIVVVLSGLLVLTASVGVSFPRTHLPVFVAGVTTVGLAPISLLFAFILRIATVTQRTASTLSFTTTSIDE